MFRETTQTEDKHTEKPSRDVCIAIAVTRYSTYLQFNCKLAIWPIDLLMCFHFFVKKIYLHFEKMFVRFGPAYESAAECIR